VKWFLGAVVLLVIGLVFNLGLLVYAMYALLGVMLLSRFLARQWIESLGATREGSRATAEIGDKAAIVVTLRNTGHLPIPWVIWEDSLPRDALKQRPPRLKVERRRLGIARLASRGERLLTYQVTFQMRGYYQIGPLLVESGDLFGLHRRYRVLADPHYVLVLPRVVPLRGYDIFSRRPIGEVRMTHRLFEDPTRLFGVRTYQRGDPLNRIHWKATARTGQLHSRIYEPSTVAGGTILLDFHRDGYPARGEPHRSELTVTCAASLAHALCQMGQQVGLVTNARDAADRIREEGFRREFTTREVAQTSVGMQARSDRLRPVQIETRRGPDQLTPILEALARAELTDGLTCAQLVTEAASRMPRDATVVAILPDVPEETAIALGNLRRQGFAVTTVVVMYDDELHAAEGLGRLMAERIDVRRIGDERELAQLCAHEVVR
jgi:uncharacterized protein (DUF58 family)